MRRERERAVVRRRRRGERESERVRGDEREGVRGEDMLGRWVGEVGEVGFLKERGGNDEGGGG